MFCPACQTVMRVDGTRCPTCGDAMHPILSTDVVEVVESSAAVAEGEAPDTHRAATLTIRAARDTDLAMQGKKQESLLARIPELSLIAWQQPAVRSAVKTGAGAVMLSLVMRVARQWLLESSRRRAVTDALVPTVGELLRPAVQGEQRRWPRGGVNVTETFIYVRRTVRQ